jgi:hypothetical protein
MKKGKFKISSKLLLEIQELIIEKVSHPPFRMKSTKLTTKSTLQHQKNI